MSMSILKVESSHYMIKLKAPHITEARPMISTWQGLVDSYRTLCSDASCDIVAIRKVLKEKY